MLKTCIPGHSKIGICLLQLNHLLNQYSYQSEMAFKLESSSFGFVYSKMNENIVFGGCKNAK